MWWDIECVLLCRAKHTPSSRVEKYCDLVDNLKT